MTVIFTDIVGFTPLSSRLKPTELVALLDGLFTSFDALVARFGGEKIKTIGDAYMVVVGAPGPRTDHVEVAARIALAIREQARAFPLVNGQQLSVRLGVDTGPVVTGVIGQHKFAYDLWSDAVNTASRMESHGEPDRIHVTEAMAARLNSRFQLVPRGEIAVKGKGPRRTFWLEGASV